MAPLLGLALLMLFAAEGRRVVPVPALASPHDAPDWPVDIAVAADGTVWLAMTTDVPTFGGLAAYSAQLGFLRATGTYGNPHAVAIDASGSIWIDETDVEMPGDRSWFTSLAPDLSLRSWWFGAMGRPIAQDIAAGGPHYVIEEDARGSGPPMLRVGRHPTGPSDRRFTLPEGSHDLAVAADRRLFVTTRQDVLRVSENGQATLVRRLGGRVEGIAAGPGDRLSVTHAPGAESAARISYFNQAGQPLGEFELHMAARRLATAPDGSLYVIVRRAAEINGQVWEIRHYAADGTLIGTLADIEPVMGLPRPPTPTPVSGPPPDFTATAVSSETPTTAATLDPVQTSTATPATGTATAKPSWRLHVPAVLTGGDFAQVDP